jgi:hypothetical protein
MIPTYTKPSKTENKSKLLLNVTSWYPSFSLRAYSKSTCHSKIIQVHLMA